MNSLHRPPRGNTSLDYLNEIAPSSTKKPLFEMNLKTIIIGAVGAIILIIIISAIAGSLGGGKKEPWQRLSARLTATYAVVDKAGVNIKNSQLRSLNGNVKIFITNTQRDLGPTLARLEVDTKKIPASITTSENGTGMDTRLEDGRLNAKYDSTYVREMTYQLSRILSLLKQLYTSSGNATTKEFLQTTYNSLEPTYKAISEFSASNE